MSKILTQFKNNVNVKIDWIERIRDSDKRKGSCDLENTIIAYVESGFDLAQASDRMFLHRNTLKYRLMRMGDILGANLTPRHLLALYYCLVCQDVFQNAR